VIEDPKWIARMEEKRSCSRRSYFEKHTLAERASMVKRKARRLPD